MLAYWLMLSVLNTTLNKDYSILFYHRSPRRALAAEGVHERPDDLYDSNVLLLLLDHRGDVSLAQLLHIGRLPRRGCLDHGFMPCCTIPPHLPTPSNLIQLWNWCVMCWESRFENLIGHFRWNLEQIWHSWHTKLTWNGSRTMGSEWPDRHYKI